MRGIAVLQARTSSTRLPGKALLPLGGMPLSVLAGKRAANTGRRVIVATSSESGDDLLAQAASEHGLPCYRGSLHNVLERVVLAVSDADDETIFIRLTGDNVFPDGKLLDELEEEFLARRLEYLACNGEPSGLPYGVSCEVTRVGHLRAALREATSASDLEHVTPWVIRRHGQAWFEKYRPLAKGHFRCTVDNYDDYVSVQHVFSHVHDAVREPLTSLIALLQGAPHQPIGAAPARKLVVGTAQLGMSYGIANTTGIPDRQASAAILKTAAANGALWIDTAQAYGDSEAVIGEALAGGWHGRLRLATKLSPLADLAADAPAALVRANVDASVYASAMRLRTQRIDALLLHRAAHLLMWQGAAWQRLLELRAQGVVDVLGVSVQDGQELRLALETPEVEMVQMPFNLLDWRWQQERDSIRRRKASGPFTTHVRSGLLQGLLCTRDPSLWRRAHVAEPNTVLEWMDTLCTRHRISGTAELSLRYAASQDWVDGVVVGMESLPQAISNIRTFALPKLSDGILEEIETTRPRLPERALDPAQWQRA